MSLNKVIPWRSFSNRWWPVKVCDTRTKTPRRGGTKTKQPESFCLQISETTQLSGASLLWKWCRPHRPATLQERWCFHRATKREMAVWIFFIFFIRDLSVSWLSSHNKSPALSWGWTFRASGRRRMTCRPLKCSGSSDGSAVLTEKYTQQSNQ